TTSPAGKNQLGKLQLKKPIADIMVAHEIPYTATASIAYWQDLMSKARKGLEVDGPAFLHVFAPCPRGWRYETDKTIEIARLATETCVFPLWEAIEGEYSLSPYSKIVAMKPERKKPVTDYLKTQRRFGHLFKEDAEHMLQNIQKIVDKRWDRLLRRIRK
ncbi:MAG: pyruvate ferredoxin oxidoreductase, partial [Candidatus Bathyarchaeota archaeon]